MAGQGYQIPGESGSLQNTVLFLAANFTLFEDSHDGHQADTADGGGVQRRKGAGPAGQAEDRRAVGDHPETQLGEAIANQIGESALDPIGGADRFFRHKADGGDADQQLRTKHQEAQRKQRGQIDVLVAGVLVNPEGGD